jgi:hypothetical protein
MCADDLFLRTFIDARPWMHAHGFTFITVVMFDVC